jgi:hypothetical protein
MLRVLRIGVGTAVLSLGISACAWGPTVDKVQRVCERANESRDVHEMADCYRLGGSLACRSDQHTRRDERCDEAVALAHRASD